MSGFLYFISGQKNPITDVVIDAVGLRYAFDVSPMHGPADGPSNSAGMLFADGKRLGDMDLCYVADPDVQCWHKRPGDDAVWIGYWKAAPPTPKSLARQRMLPGESLELCDGNNWHVPRLMVYFEGEGFSSALPHRATRNDAGQWTNGDVLPRYSKYLKLAQRLYDGMYKSHLGGAKPIDNLEMLDIAAELLGVNYAIGVEEAGLLGLLPTDEESLKSFAHIATDRETFEDWYEKKNGESGLAAGAGSSA